MSAPNVPDGAPAACPGTQADDAGKSAACAGCPNQSACASGAAKEVDPGEEPAGARAGLAQHARCRRVREIAPRPPG